jgi:5-methylcytosine-specific restriction endonuclease McrA
MKSHTQSHACSRDPQGSQTECCARSNPVKPTFTSPSAGASRPYVASKSKTNSGMLLQSRTLKAPAVDKARDRSETGGGRSASRRSKLAGNMDEKSGAAQAAPVTAGGNCAGEFAGRKASIVTSNRVFVLGAIGKPLMPCHPARARELLKSGDAVVHRRFPFVIRLKSRTAGAAQPVAIKLDPGAKTTGGAVVRLDTLNPKKQHVLIALEVEHRGSVIRDNLTQRAAFRRARRSRNLRYRAPRFNNRGGDKRGWLPPSLRHRIETTASWVARLRRWVPVSGLAMELVRFDTQLLENPDITGVEYQQGALAGYEVREFVLERGGHKCAYCGAENIPLNLDHVVSRARGGSDRVSNLVPSCIRCNQAKGSMDVRSFVKDAARLSKILAQTKKSLSGAAAVNATRFALHATLVATGLPVETGTGGRTKWNRSRFGLPKSHALDASCVGQIDSLSGPGAAPLSIKCMGRGSHQRTRLTAHGFPRAYLSPQKSHFGFRTGDIVSASVSSGKRKGHYLGRVAVRATGNFNIQTNFGAIQGISHRFCKTLQRADGYAY